MTNHPLSVCRPNPIVPETSTEHLKPCAQFGKTVERTEQAVKQGSQYVLNSTEIYLALHHCWEAIVLLLTAYSTQNHGELGLASLKVWASVKHLWHVSKPFRPFVRSCLIDIQLQRLEWHLVHVHGILLDTSGVA